MFLSVVCGVRRQEIIVRDRNVLFSSAGYKVNINVTTIGPLTTSSAGITVCSLIVSAAYGLESFRL